VHRALLLSLTALLAAACSDKSTDYSTDSGGGADGSDGSDGSDGETGTDEDGDGVTVEDGDCDDTDYRVNPAYPEDPEDGVDNDCDGRIDEVWSGLAIAEQSSGGGGEIVLLDSVGRVEGRIAVGETPWTLTEGVGGGWAVTTYPYFQNISAGFSLASSGLVLALDDSVPWYQPATVQLVQDGASETTLATFGDEGYDACFALPEDDWGDCLGELDPRSYFFGPYVRGLATHPDGWYAVLTPGALHRLDPDGTVTELASWGWNIATRDVTPFELYGGDLAIDPATGTLGISGLLGGFATWQEGAGLTVHKSTSLPVELTQADIDALYITVGVSWMDGDGWYTMSARFTEGSFAVRRFNLNEGDWVDKVTWINDLIQPLGMTTDGDQGDWYVTSKAGDIRSTFRVRGADSSIDDFSTETTEGRTYWGVTHRY
jgi:hypothetical protein